MRDSVTTRQIFSCTTKSIRIDARMPKAKAAPMVAVKVAVWVMKPGPMAEVAIRKTAASRELRRFLTASVADAAKEEESLMGVIFLRSWEQGGAWPPWRLRGLINQSWCCCPMGWH